jgi:hypothetical protein
MHVDGARALIRVMFGRQDESRGAGCVYNETCYSRDRGEPYSGWCVRTPLT